MAQTNEVDKLWPETARRFGGALEFSRLDFAVLSADGSHYSLRTVFDRANKIGAVEESRTCQDIGIASQLFSSTDKCRTACIIPRHNKEAVDKSRAGDLRAVMACRLEVRENTLGALVFGTDVQDFYNETDVEIASRFADHVAVAMERCATAAALAANQREWEGLIKALQAAVRSRDDFISIAAHELRTPLNTLGLRMEVLRQRFVGAGDNTPAEIANVIQQADRLAALINNLLDCSQLASGRLEMNFARDDLAAAVHEVVARQENNHPRGAGRVNLDLPDHLYATFDHFKIDQVITNLLSNAFKYGEEKAVDVRLYAIGGKARLVVRDHGVGVSATDKVRIFERFQRGERTCGSRGFGLGLFIAREIVGAHGGSIAVDNALGGGAAFCVELPLSSVAPGITSIVNSRKDRFAGLNSAERSEADPHSADRLSVARAISSFDDIYRER